MRAFVAPIGANSLDAILTRNSVETVDLLSIDVDSDDLAIWSSVEKFRPKIVVIEYNPTIPFDVRYINEPGKRERCTIDPRGCHE